MLTKPRGKPKQRMTVKLARELCAGILRDELEHSQVRNARQVAAVLRRSVKRAEAAGIPAEALQRYLGRVAKMMGTIQRLLLAEGQWVRKRAKHQA